MKYSASGEELWTAGYDGTGIEDADSDEPRAIAVDSNGNVYITGVSPGPAIYCDYATIKYGPRGQRLWVARYDGPNMEEDRPFDVAVDGAGNVHVSGGTFSPLHPVGGYPLFSSAMVKDDPNGQQLWAAIHPAEVGLGDVQVTVEGAGNVHAHGSDRPTQQNPAAAVDKYNPLGRGSGPWYFPAGFTRQDSSSMQRKMCT